MEKIVLKLIRPTPKKPFQGENNGFYITNLWGVS